MLLCNTALGNDHGSNLTVMAVLDLGTIVLLSFCGKGVLDTGWDQEKHSCSATGWEGCCYGDSGSDLLLGQGWIHVTCCSNQSEDLNLTECTLALWLHFILFIVTLNSRLLKCFFWCKIFILFAEFGCSISAEHLTHTQLESAVGCNWTGGSWKGKTSTRVAV